MKLNNKNNNILVIDALIFENGKAFGYQEYLFNLLDYFFDRREELLYQRVIIACPENQKEFFQKYQSKLEVIGFKIKCKVQHLIVQNLFTKKLKLKKTDTVLYTYNYSSIFKNCFHILVVHDLIFLRRQYLPNVLMRWQRKIFIPISLRHADKIIAISDFTKNDLIKNYKISKGKVITIYNYFNFEKYKTSQDFYKCINPYFISICSTAYHKNTVSVLKAFEKFCKHNSVYDIVFVGGLKDKKSDAFLYYEQLNEDIKKRIHLLTEISNPELGMIYRNAKCFISLTLFEGLGMPIVEAMYFNNQLILSNLEVCREVASGAHCYFVDPFDIDTIVSAMESIVEKNVIVSTRELVQKRFSKENTSGKYIELLNSEIKNKYKGV